ncbi:hypothetical protein GN244_ATG17742 [Phytophthora infestans]|uniref:DUF4704 domain-containing protein n=1 Tax=Phytophthora infestans TaxID=4787 RepID=A0A833SGP5_PHYIN|nr:hypothetical protein GN244_ATG17742 [Phytophthora infestans]
MIFPEYHAAWYRSVGVSSLPVILDYLLTACEKITRKQDAAETEQSGERPLSAVVESVVVDLLWILKGMLLSNVANQQEVLGNYVFHMLSHVMSLFDVMPSPRRAWTWGEPPFPRVYMDDEPSFASGVRAILLDYRLWTQADFKTQSIYNHQMYGLACEYPRAFNNMQAVSKVLEILGRFYSVPHSSHASGDTESSQSSQQITEPDDKDHHWKQQSIQSLVEVIEVCLTNQSTQVHEVLEQEVMETTFARSNPVSSGGSAAGGAAPSTSPNAPSSASTPPTIVVPGRKGGVFSINLESIVWSDQTATGAASTGKSDGATTDEYTATARKSVLHSVQVRFSGA